jgi:hypothetical protein
MRRILWISLTLLLLIACRTLLPVPEPTATLTAVPPTVTLTPIPPSPTLTPSPSTTLTVTSPPPTSTPSVTDTVTRTPADVFTVRYHPDGGLYVGDQVSLEVIAPARFDQKDTSVIVEVEIPERLTFPAAKFTSFGIQGRQQATLIWVWDTRNLEAGDYTLTFTIQPGGTTWSETVRLQSTDQLPAGEANAQWATVTSECCVAHYFTNTAGERDITGLLEQADEEARIAAQQMGITFSEPITFTILPRVLGHGGFASDEIHVSYLDRNYAADSWYMVLHHEMVHILDHRLGGDLRPSILVEGLAVYLSGGHYKPEPLLSRASALLEPYLDRYLPLATLADDFYAAQHEIGYLQAGALVQYMIERWGWEAFSAFYRDIHPHASNSQALAIDAALQIHFGLTFSELEEDFLLALQGQPDSMLWMEDVRLTVMHFDTLRRYQQAFDPSAYFRTAWLMDSKAMRERGIVADYLRHPNAPINQALESMLVTSSQLLKKGQYAQAEQILSAVNIALDASQTGEENPLAADPLAEDYQGIILAAQAAGYRTQQIFLNGNQATAWCTAESAELVSLNFSKERTGWVLVNE